MHFAKGNCRDGDDCLFSHEDGGGDGDKGGKEGGKGHHSGHHGHGKGHHGGKDRDEDDSDKVKVKAEAKTEAKIVGKEEKETTWQRYLGASM